jgi:hypothetical protein
MAAAPARQEVMFSIREGEWYPIAVQQLQQVYQFEIPDHLVRVGLMGREDGVLILIADTPDAGFHMPVGSWRPSTTAGLHRLSFSLEFVARSLILVIDPKRGTSEFWQLGDRDHG